MNISNSGVGKYRTNPKKCNTPDSGVSEYFRKKKEFEEEIFYAIFLIYPLFLLTLFRWKKKSLRDIFAFNNNSPQVEHIAKTKKIQAQRKKIK